MLRDPTGPQRPGSARQSQVHSPALGPLQTDVSSDAWQIPCAWEGSATPWSLSFDPEHKIPAPLLSPADVPSATGGSRRVCAMGEPPEALRDSHP